MADAHSLGVYIADSVCAGAFGKAQGAVMQTVDPGSAVLMQTKLFPSARYAHGTRLVGSLPELDAMRSKRR